MLFRLLVEGPDDAHLVKNLLREHHVVLNKEDIVECGGIATLLDESLPTHLKGSYDAIGVIVDADAHLSSRWQAICDRLARRKYATPKEPPPDGLILRPPKPLVGVWLMPDNTVAGTLEDFARHLIPEQDDLWPHATAAVSAIPRPRRFPPTAERKAEIHTYLAWQHEPGTPLRLAVTKRYFQTDGSLAQRFVDWVRKLINE